MMKIPTRVALAGLTAVLLLIGMLSVVFADDPDCNSYVVNALCSYQPCGNDLDSMDCSQADLDACDETFYQSNPGGAFACATSAGINMKCTISLQQNGNPNYAVCVSRTVCYYSSALNACQPGGPTNSCPAPYYYNQYCPR